MNGQIICKQFDIFENVKTFYEDWGKNVVHEFNEIDIPGVFSSLSVPSLDKYTAQPW